MISDSTQQPTTTRNSQPLNFRPCHTAIKYAGYSFMGSFSGDYVYSHRSKLDEKQRINPDGATLLMCLFNCSDRKRAT